MPGILESGAHPFPQIINTGASIRIDPTGEGYPDLIALPDEPYWVRWHEADFGQRLGRARRQPPRHSLGPKESSPWPGAGSLPAATSRPISIDVTPTISSPSWDFPSRPTSRGRRSPAR